MPDPASTTVTFVTLRPGILAEKSLTIPDPRSGHPAVTPITVKHYARLLGRTIKEIRFESFEGDGDPLPILILDDGSTAAAYCDPEGNGPGYLDIQDARP